MDAASVPVASASACSPPARSLGGSSAAAARRRKQAASAKNPQSYDKFKKTVMCRFLPNCRKGPECPFAHAEDEVRARPDLSKTRMCAGYYDGRCQRSPTECPFAHGEHELRAGQQAALMAGQEIDDNIADSLSALLGSEGGTPTEKDMDVVGAATTEDVSPEAEGFADQTQALNDDVRFVMFEADASFDNHAVPTTALEGISIEEAGVPFGAQQSHVPVHVGYMAIEADGARDTQATMDLVHSMWTFEAEPVMFDNMTPPLSYCSRAPEASPSPSWTWSGSTRSLRSISQGCDTISDASGVESHDEDTSRWTTDAAVDGLALPFVARRKRQGGAGVGEEAIGGSHTAAAPTAIEEGPVRDFMAKCLANIASSGGRRDGFATPPTPADVQLALLRAMPEYYED